MLSRVCAFKLVNQKNFQQLVTCSMQTFANLFSDKFIVICSV